MVRVTGTLEIAGSDGKALIHAFGERLLVRLNGFGDGLSMLRGGALKSLSKLSEHLAAGGLTVAVDAGFGLYLVLGREAKPGPVERALGVRYAALTRSLPAGLA